MKTQRLLIYLFSIILFLHSLLSVSAWVRSNKDEWFVKRYKPEYLKPGDGNYPLIGDRVSFLFAYTNSKTHKEIYTEWNKKDPEKLFIGMGKIQY